MARVKRVQPTRPVIPHYCGECARGKWIEKHRNKDLHGNYIALRCPFHEFAKLRGEPACEKFKPRNG